MQKYLLLSLLFSTLILFPTNALAGGGLVAWLNVTSTNDDYNNYRVSTINPGEQFIVKPQVHLPNDDSYDSTIRWCVNCPIKVKLENPQEGDIINPNSDKTDENGQIYAKIVSKIPGKRYVYAEVTLPESNFTKQNGTTYRSTILVLNYSGETSWEPTYNVSTPIPQPISVINEVAKPMPTQAVNSISSNSEEVKNLNEKVNNLEKELEESKQKQSVLEAKIKQLVNFIKSIFPFFN